jgi:hypothetical protein
MPERPDELEQIANSYLNGGGLHGMSERERDALARMLIGSHFESRREGRELRADFHKLAEAFGEFVAIRGDVDRHNAWISKFGPEIEQMVGARQRGREEGIKIRYTLKERAIVAVLVFAGAILLYLFAEWIRSGAPAPNPIAPTLLPLLAEKAVDGLPLLAAALAVGHPRQQEGDEQHGQRPLRRYAYLLVHSLSHRNSLAGMGRHQLVEAMQSEAGRLRVAARQGRVVESTQRPHAGPVVTEAARVSQPPRLINAGRVGSGEMKQAHLPPRGFHPPHRIP